MFTCFYNINNDIESVIHTLFTLHSVLTSVERRAADFELPRPLHQTMATISLHVNMSKQKFIRPSDRKLRWLSAVVAAVVFFLVLFPLFAHLHGI